MPAIPKSKRQTFSDLRRFDLAMLFEKNPAETTPVPANAVKVKIIELKHRKLERGHGPFADQKIEFALAREDGGENSVRKLDFAA